MKADVRAGGRVDRRRDRDHRPDAAAGRGARAPARDAGRGDRRDPAARRARGARDRRHGSAGRRALPRRSRGRRADRRGAADGGQPALGGGARAGRRGRGGRGAAHPRGGRRGVPGDRRARARGADRRAAHPHRLQHGPARRAPGWGTALGVVYAKAEAGEPVEVFACETRPLLQGARLTAWELEDAGIPVTVLADGAAPTLLARGDIDAVIVGCDRVAANGDVANKIGTYALAIAARHHGVPFYVAGPRSTLDPATPTGAEIEIEERDGDEIRLVAGLSARTEVWNPAFDVTPAELITGLITDAGVLRAPYGPAIAEALRVDDHRRLPRRGRGAARGARGAGARPGRGAGGDARLRDLRQRPHGVVPGVARAARARPRAGGRRRRHRRAARRAAPRIRRARVRAPPRSVRDVRLLPARLRDAVRHVQGDPHPPGRVLRADPRPGAERGARPAARSPTTSATRRRPRSSRWPAACAGCAAPGWGTARACS